MPIDSASVAIAIAVTVRCLASDRTARRRSERRARMTVFLEANSGDSGYTPWTEESAGGLADRLSGIILERPCAPILPGLPARWSRATLVLFSPRSPTERRASLRWLARSRLTALYFIVTLQLTPPFAWAQGSAPRGSDP